MPADLVRCEDVAARAERSPRAGDLAMSSPARDHVETCLRCQADLVQYRRLLRTLRSLRTEVLQPAPGLLPEILAGIEHAGERHAIRAVLHGRRAAYIGGHRRGHRRRRGRGHRAGQPEPQAQARRLTAHRLRNGDLQGSVLASSVSHTAEGSSSTGRAPVSKTGGWGFDSLLPCSRTTYTGVSTSWP